MNHYIARSWHKKGSQPIKPYAYDKKKKISLFGALGHDCTLTHQATSLNSQNFITFLNKIQQKHEKVLLIMDNVQMHFSKLMTPYYQKHPGIQILRTPKYSPQHNPIEIYWKNIKQWVGLKITLTIKQLTQTVQEATKKQNLIPHISKI